MKLPRFQRPAAIRSEQREIRFEISEPGIDPAETFRPSADGRSIERWIALRNGHRAQTRVRVDGESLRSLSEAALAERFDQAFLRSRRWPRLTQHPRDIRVVDLFSGCGSMSLGMWEAARAVGARMVPVMALDFNQTALGVYEQNFRGVWAVSDPIESILDGQFGTPPSKAEREVVERVEHVDILIGGPPCQGHSNLNNHTRRADPKNKLYDRMARFAELVRPTHVIIENVSAVLHDKGKVVERTMTHLRQMDYFVGDAVVEGVALGIPQRRRRHFVVASLQRKVDVDVAVDAFTRPPRSVAWAISDLARLRTNRIIDQLGKISETNQQRIDYLFKNRLFELPDEMRPDCHRLQEHSYKSVYGRLRPDLPAQTITSGFLSMGQGRYVHPSQRRTITPHEAARLQFVPDFFSFEGVSKRTALAEMIGNAVPTKLAYVLGVNLLR